MLPHCNSSMSWLSAETAGMLGPFLLNLRSDDVDSSPKERVSGGMGCGKRGLEVSSLQNRFLTVIFCPSLLLVALWVFPHTQFSAGRENEQQDETQPGQEVSAEVFPRGGLRTTCREVCILPSYPLSLSSFPSLCSPLCVSVFSGST